MEKAMINKVEQKLRRHYRRVRQLEQFQHRLKVTNERIVETEDNIRNCNHRIENPLKSPSISGTPGGGTDRSSIEIALIRAFEKMERDLATLYQRQASVQSIVIRISDEVEAMDMVIAGLKESNRKLIEIRYKHGRTLRELEGICMVDHAVINRRIRKILAWIAEEMIEIA